jgi:hypothetical protein
MSIDRRKDLLIDFVALLALAGLLYTSSRKKETDLMSMPSQGGGGSKVPVPSQPLGQTDNYAGAYGVRTTTHGVQGVKSDEPSTLLPNDSNSQWASLNPQGGGMLKNINLLQAGSLVGINTVGSSLRNANLQVRSEPPNPQGNVGPWNHSTIEPDFVRLPLEIGSMGGKQ